ncbi:MAG: cytochrome P460 family protein [Pseudomonadales bacterium]
MLPAALLGVLLGAAACTDRGADPGPVSIPDDASRAFNCPDPDAAEAGLRALNLLDHHGPILPTEAQFEALQKFVVSRGYASWCQDQFRSTGVRMTGPVLPARSRTTGAVANTAFSTHARVKVYYSKDVVTWLENGRTGGIPDGSMIVKAMWPGAGETTADADIDGWAVMFRDSRASKDGWLWYLYYRPGNVPYRFEFESAQYGLSFCLACHASATAERTFASLDNLSNSNPVTFVRVIDPSLDQADDGGAHHLLEGVDTPPPGSTEEKALRIFAYLPLQSPAPPDVALLQAVEAHAGVEDAAAIAARKPRELPMDVMFDHVPAAPTPTDPGFITASTCNGCHDTSDLLNGTNPEMSVPLNGHTFDKPVFIPRDPELANLSPYGEWSGSLMSVSARDPVFRAQLEWETSTYPDLPGDPRAAEITRRCLHCHAAMGARTDPTLAADLENTYTVPPGDRPNSHEAVFAGLARDGVSCAVCHRMAADGLGKPETFNANFEIGPADEIYGPYDDVRTLPMHNALGITPLPGAQIRDSGLCGSCHMVDVPVMDHPERPTAHEQTTYYEWRNSDFAGSGETCQSCHMPDVNPLMPDLPAVESRIANIEDTSFPHTAHRADSDALDTESRRYRRHTLTGINLFTMAMFEQFPMLLGSNTWYPSRPVATLVSPKAFAIEEARNLARNATARVRVSDLSIGEPFGFTVSVENLAGHKFPSGVGFRRAFLEIALLGGDDEVLWCSGCTDRLGFILDGNDGARLPAELPRESNAFQPYHPEISAEDQVQIYETRHVNHAGQLTTSFVELDLEVKDTRLLPRGWDSTAFPEYDMNPVGRTIPDPAHIDRFRVRPAGVSAAAVQSIRVRIYYQALPPYYLLDRFSLLARDTADAYPETQRLLHIVSRLNLDDGSSARHIRGWRLLVDEHRMPVHPPLAEAGSGAMRARTSKWSSQRNVRAHEASACSASSSCCSS